MREDFFFFGNRNNPIEKETERAFEMSGFLHFTLTLHDDYFPLSALAVHPTLDKGQKENIKA